MPNILLEVCVDDALGLAAAIQGGADRVELCAALSVGGLTPSPGLMDLAARAPIPAYPMIRPRPGDFVFHAAEIDQMKADIRAARGYGLTGVVLGANRPDGTLDTDTLAELVAQARGLDLTLHRAIDLCPDPEQAVEQAVALGFRRILTSGGALKAVDGLPRLARMFAAAKSRLVIMPGSGVSLETLPALAKLPVTEIHASCAAGLPANPAALAFGFQTGQEKRTDAGTVAALKSALMTLSRRS